MTMVTPNATPKRLKKRNLGKLGTAGVALFAGAALAASSFGVTQAASAFYTPDYEEAPLEYQFVAADDESVVFLDRGNGLDVDRIGRTGAGEVIVGEWDQNMLAATPSAEFSIENRSDERAIVYLDGAQFKAHADPSETDDDEAFDNLYITIVDRNESSSRNLEANGGRTDETTAGYQHQTIVENVKLSELGRVFIADIAERIAEDGDGFEPDGRIQAGYDYDIYLTTPTQQAGVGEDPADLEKRIGANWDFEYDLYGYTPGSASDQAEAYLRAGFEGEGGDASSIPSPSPAYVVTDGVAENAPSEDDFPSEG